MPKEWVVVVNRVEARVFLADSMERIHRLSNSLGREKNRKFTTDKPGVGRGRLGRPSTTHNLTGEKHPHDEAAIQFARRLGLFLKRRLDEKKFAKVKIVAEPRMAGWLRSVFDKNLLSRCEWNRKDLGKTSDHGLKILFLGKESVWPVSSSL